MRRDGEASSTAQNKIGLLDRKPLTRKLASRRKIRDHGAEKGLRTRVKRVGMGEILGLGFEKCVGLGCLMEGKKTFFFFGGGQV